jgi:hypothetical protein
MEDGVNINLHGDYDTNVWRIDSEEDFTVGGGAYYVNMTYHWVDSPVGYSPPVLFIVGYTRLKWIPE